MQSRYELGKTVYSVHLSFCRCWLIGDAVVPPYLPPRIHRLDVRFIFSSHIVSAEAGKWGMHSMCRMGGFNFISKQLQKTRIEKLIWSEQIWSFPFPPPPFLLLFLLVLYPHLKKCFLILDEEERRENEGERNIYAREKHQVVASFMCPECSLNPQPRCVP